MAETVATLTDKMPAVC